MDAFGPAWLGKFRALHERARRGELVAAELRAYRDGRDALASVLLAAQQVTLPAGQSARRSVRVARAVQVVVGRGDRTERAPTLDLSATGFAAWIATPLEAGEEVDVALSLPRGGDLRSRARVVAVQRYDGSAHASVGFQFLALPSEDRERLETYVFDAILDHLR